LAHWVGALGQIKFAKKVKIPPLVMSPAGVTRPQKKKNFFQSQQEDLLNPQRFEQLSGSFGW